MSDWRPFGFRGEPDTCKWCGKKLRRKTWPADPPKGMALADWYGSPESKRRVPAFDQAGDYGDGHFCGLRCGYQFGKRLADLGRRLVSKTHEEDR